MIRLVRTIKDMNEILNALHVSLDGTVCDIRICHFWVGITDNRRVFYRAFETISFTMNLNFPARVRSIASTSVNWTFQPALFEAMLFLMASKFVSSKLYVQDKFDDELIYGGLCYLVFLDPVTCRIKTGG